MIIIDLRARPTYYTAEVGGSSVWQISKKKFAGVIYGQKSLMCKLCSLKRFPVNSLMSLKIVQSLHIVVATLVNLLAV